MRHTLLAIALTFAAPAVAQEKTVTVRLTFDPAAVAAMLEKGEWVTVSTYFFGDPAPGNTLPEDEMGQVYLGAETVTLWPADQTIQIGGSLGAAPMSSVIAPSLNVNVFSARFSTEDNILDCGIVDGPFADMAASMQTINCTLIQ